MVDPHLVLLIYYVYPLAVYATIKYPISLQPLVWAVMPHAKARAMGSNEPITTTGEKSRWENISVYWTVV